MDYIEPRGNLFYAVYYVPADVQKIMGKKKFLRSTKTNNRSEAIVRARQLVTGWEAEVAKARGRLPNTKDTFWESLRREYLLAGDDEGLKLALEELAETAASKITDPEQSSGLYRFATNQVGQLLAPLVEDWKASLRISQKTIDQQHRDVLRMAEHFVSLEALQPRAVKEWTDKLIAAGATTASIDRIGNGCHSLWRYLQRSGVVPMEMPDPFDGSFALARTTAKKVTVDRKAFTADELVTVYEHALSKRDDSLAKVIALGAFTGARIEEICSLKVTNCVDGMFRIVDSKTAAGVRQVPIHPALEPLVDKMIKGSADGYLVPSKAAGKYGVRSDSYSKRFGRMKESMGFSTGHVFHSIRKTVATLLEQAGVKESIAADILGHEKKSMTFGLYSDGSSMEQKRDAMALVVYGGALGRA
jgi:integrase